MAVKEVKYTRGAEASHRYSYLWSYGSFFCFIEIHCLLLHNSVNLVKKGIEGEVILKET